MKVQQMAGHTHMHIYGVKQGSFTEPDHVHK